MTETRLENIEIKLTSQEDLLDTLNMQVYEQQKENQRTGTAVCRTGQAT